jgi:ribosome-associated protein YbcJ (S4-like RNA binding protein)
LGIVNRLSLSASIIDCKESGTQIKKMIADMNVDTVGKTLKKKKEKVH